MSHKIPTVSIGMPAYNEGRFIAQTLDSLLAQDFKDFELIISDNASEDETHHICLDYSKRDSRIRYYRNERNLGSVRNFNRVFELSRGKYFMWAGGHDLWHPSYISRCVEVLEREPETVLCYTKTLLIDMDSKPLEIMPDSIDTRSLSAPQRFLVLVRELDWCNMFFGVIRSDALRKVRPLKSNIVGPDMILLTELSLVGAFAQIPEPLYYRRQNRPQEDQETMVKRQVKMLNPTNKVKRYNPRRVIRRRIYRYLLMLPRAPLSYSWKAKLAATVISDHRSLFVPQKYFFLLAPMKWVYRTLRRSIFQVFEVR